VGAVCFYISGHGFGHASRQIEIINALGAIWPSPRLLIRTSAPRWLFDRTLRVPAELVPGECDTGVVQIDSLRLDAEETIRRAASFYATLDERARSEAAFLRRHDVELVISDAPPLACAAAAAAAIASIVVANFTWDWIYEGYVPEIQAAPHLADTIRHAYGLAAAAWRLPMHGGFQSFRQVIDVPFVARHARHSRADVRRTCGLPEEARVALLSFGGYGVRDVDLDRIDCLDRYVVAMTHDGTFDDPVPANVALVAEPHLYGSGMRYEDLVAAVDVVMTKPGYGIISECIANQAAILYTSRGRFAEYEVMVREMPRFLRCGYIDQQDLFAGRWGAALDGALSAPPPPEQSRTEGAGVVANMIKRFMGS
jgi:L-arabinokinase